MSFRKAELPIDVSSKSVFGMEYDRNGTDRNIDRQTGKSIYSELMEMGVSRDIDIVLSSRDERCYII